MLFFKLLTTPSHNPKSAKGLAYGYANFIMMLAPGNESGYEVCPDRSPSCTVLCLYNQGRGRMTGAQIARKRRTVAYFEQRTQFLAMLINEIRLAIAWSIANNLIPVFRLNGLSDIPWEYVRVTDGGIEYPNIFALFPEIQWYDYFKGPRRLRNTIPANYYLLFSRAENNHEAVIDMLEANVNVAVVFNGTLPDEVTVGGRTYPVHGGDVHDLRFLDPVGVVVGLSGKGTAKKDETGFAVDTEVLASLGNNIDDYNLLIAANSPCSSPAAVLYA